VLTDLKIRKAEVRDRPYRIADGDNLYIYIAPTA